MKLKEKIHYKIYKLTITTFIIICFYFPHNIKADFITVFKDNEIESYVKNIATPLLCSAGIDPNIVNFYLVDDPNPNAFVTGGQNVFIFSGLLTFINSDDELAGILAHEIAHITEGHVLQGSILAKKSQVVFLVSLLLGTIAAALNPAYLGAALATVTAVPTIITNNTLFYSRADEMQADKLAVHLLQNTPYSGYGLINFMERLKKLEGNPNYIMAWYSTHPLTTTRIKFLESYISQNNKIKHCKTSESLLRVKSKLDAINLNYASYIKKYPSNNNIDLYGLSIAELKISNYNNAINIINKLLKKFPNDPFYLELLGDIYYSSNQFKYAYKTYIKIPDVNKDYIINLKIAKSIYITDDKGLMLQNSLQYVNISLGKNSYSPLAWHLKSLILTKLNEPYLASLAMAQKYINLGEKNKAMLYAKQALSGIKENQPEWIEAQDIIQKIRFSSN